MMTYRRLAAVLALCTCTAAETSVAEGVDAWLERIKGLAATPAPPDIGPREVEAMFHLRPRSEECPSDLELAPDHPAFISHASASLMGAPRCDSLRLGMIEIVVKGEADFLPHALSYFTEAFSCQPHVEQAGRNTFYRWSFSARRAVVVTSYDSASNADGVGVTFIKIQPVPE